MVNGYVVEMLSASNEAVGGNSGLKNNLKHKRK